METQSNLSEARGVELLAQWRELVHAAGQHTSALEAWEKARTVAEWDLIKVAQFGAGKVGLRALVKQYEDYAPIGQRR